MMKVSTVTADHTIFILYRRLSPAREGFFCAINYKLTDFFLCNKFAT